MLRRTWVFWFILVLGFCAVAVAGLAITESVVRQAYLERGDAFAEVRKRYIRLRENTPGAALITHVRMDGADRDIVVRADADGFIEPSAVHSNPDLKIVFLGGSTTQSINVDEKLRFPYLAGRNLEADLGRKVNSYNAAFLGNNSMHSNNILINKVVPLAPDYAIMMHNVNDLALSVDYWKEDESFEYGLIGQFEELPGVPRDLFGLFKMIKDATIPYTYNLVRMAMTSTDFHYEPEEIRPLVGQPRRSHEQKTLAEYELGPIAKQRVAGFSRSLRLFIAGSRVFEIEPVLMTQPTSGVIVKGSSDQNKEIHERFQDMHAVFNQTIREVAEQEGAFVIDLETALERHPRQGELFYDMVHYNEEGSVFIAEVIARELAKQIRGDAGS